MREKVAQVIGGHVGTVSVLTYYIQLSIREVWGVRCGGGTDGGALALGGPGRWFEPGRESAVGELHEDLAPVDPLLHVVEGATHTLGLGLQIAHKPIAQIMNSWTTQMGFPLIEVQSRTANADGSTTLACTQR